MYAVLATSYIAVKAVEGTTAVRIDGIVIEEPGVAPPGLIENRLYKYFIWHLVIWEKQRQRKSD